MRFSTEHRTINTFHFSAALNVIMILLIFVVMIFAYYSKSGVQIKLSSGAFPNQIGITKNEVVINEHDKIFIDKVETSVEELLERFSSLKRDKFTALIVHPNKLTRFNTVINVIKTAKKVGINNIAVQTDMVSY
jgi:biopolymer transport protein ExbD